MENLEGKVEEFVQAKYLLGDEEGNFAIWNKRIPKRLELIPEKALPMSITVPAAFVGVQDLNGKVKVRKNKLGEGNQTIQHFWETAPEVVCCYDGLEGREKLVGIKALNGFTIGKTDMPIHFVGIDKDGKVVKYYPTIFKAKAASDFQILGFEIEGNLVLKLQRGKFGFEEISVT